MLSGDDLSVQLFIAALAFTAWGIAVTQAGWDHKFFIRSLFFIGALLLLLAFAWGPISRTLPVAAEGLSLFTSSPWTWLILIICSFASLLLMERRARNNLVEKLLHEASALKAAHSETQSTSETFNRLMWPKVSEWLSPSEAIQKFVSPHLLSEFQIALGKHNEAAEAYDQIYRDQPSDGSELQALLAMAEPGHKGDAIRTALKTKQAMEVEAIRAKGRLVSELVKHLRKGTLVAKGALIQPNSIPGRWEYIKSAAWVVLAFDLDDLETARGGGNTYKGIQIGKDESGHSGEASNAPIESA